jgi:hypothetical protein
VVDVLVRDDYRCDGFRQHLHELEARRHSTRRESGVYEHAGSSGLDQYCVAFAAATENVYDHGAGFPRRR